MSIGVGYSTLRLHSRSTAARKFCCTWLIFIEPSCLLKSGGLEMEGVYRVNGGQLTMKKLKTSFDQGKFYCRVWLFNKSSCYDWLLASFSVDISYPLIQKYEFLFSDARSVLLTLDECGVHDVTGVLKQYLRQLPDPVIPGTMYRQFISAGSKY